MVTGLAITAICLAIISLLTSIVALGIVLGMKWSSHKIEFKPLITGELKEEEKFKEEEEDDKFLQHALNLSQSKKKKKQEEDPLDTLLQTSNF